MRRRLKTTKNKNKQLWLLFLFFGGFAYSFYYVVNISLRNYVIKNDEVIVDLILDTTLGSINIANLEELKKPSFIVKYMLDGDLRPKDTIPSPKESVDSVLSENLVYIYNSHPTESYNGELLEDFSIVPTVVTVDYMLKEYLANYGISAYVEPQSVVNILKDNNWKYGYSYKASRILLEHAFQTQPSLSYFIDIHRDSASYKTTFININGKGYARILFVIGEEYETYKQNLSLANRIYELINQKYPGLSRGVITKSGIGVNGVYNQDFSPNCILIEVGGQDNTIDEINNTVQIISEALSQIIGVYYE